MSSQYSSGKNPPWARQDYSTQGVAGLMQTGMAYPYSQAQAAYAQPNLASSGGQQAGLLSQTMGVSNLQGSQVGTVSYPVKSSNSSSGSTTPNQKQRIFTGTVTKIHDNFGFVDEEVFFQISCVKGALPKVGDRVLVEASYNANMPFKWNATRVISLPETAASNQLLSLQQQQQQLKSIQQQAISVMGASGMLGAMQGLAGGQGLMGSAPAGQGLMGSGPAGHGLMGNMPAGQGLMGSVPGPPSLMSGLGKFHAGGMYASGNRVGMNAGSGMMGDSLRGGQRGGLSITGRDNRRDRDRRDRRDISRKRSRSPVKKSRSPAPRARSPRSPPKRKAAAATPRYVVQVPRVLLDVPDSCVISLKSKYSNMYIPSDFFHASNCWVENFPLTRPFTLGQPCNFQIMHKDVLPLKKETVVLEPEDADHLFSAKVMLLASPPEEELYKRSCCLAEDMPDCMDTFQHPTRLLQFLVGTRGKNDPMAIGGPWSPSLDGANPQSNPQVLIKTAIRTTRALTGIDLSACTQWFRFAEIRYFRQETRHKDRVQPARVETVVIFLPDVWTCNPTRLEWMALQATYQKRLQRALNPGQPQEEEDDEASEDRDMAEGKEEPSHYSTLDLKTIKIEAIRRQLELRNVSAKGLKSQLLARLTKILATERDKDNAKLDIQEPAATKDNTSKEEGVEGDGTNDSKEDEEKRKKEKKDRAILERRYKLNDAASVLVHPSVTAKGGKFECAVMSLSLLLDYRPEDNKEHSFEVSLFAELFNEMLMRDFGFKIYTSLVSSAARVDSQKKSTEEKKDKEESSKEEKKDKKQEKQQEKSQEPSPKRKKTGDTNDKNGQEDGKGDNSSSGRDTKNGGDDDIEDNEEDDNAEVTNQKDDQKKKKEEVRQMMTANPALLLAFSYFDQNHCGYLTDKDAEDIIHTLGLKLSRAQIKKLLLKLVQQDQLNYRTLTDQDTSEDNMKEQGEVTELKLDAEQMAKGNRETLRKLLELSGVKPDPSSIRPQATTLGSGNTDSPGFLYYRGAVVDIDSLMNRLDRSEKSRTALEKNLQEMTDELKTVKTHLVERESSCTKLQYDLRRTRVDLDQEKSLVGSLQAQNTEWHRAAQDSRSHMMSALHNLTDLLSREESRTRKEEHKPRTDEIRSQTENTRPKSDNPVNKAEESQPKLEDAPPKADNLVPKAKESQSKLENTQPKAEDDQPKLEDTQIKDEDTPPKVDNTLSKGDSLLVEGDEPRTEDDDAKISDENIKQNPQKAVDTKSKNTEKQSSQKDDDTKSKKTEKQTPQKDDNTKSKRRKS